MEKQSQVLGINMIFRKHEILWVCFAAALLSVGVPSKAQSVRDTSATTELLLDGDDIVTTATRTAQKLSESPVAVTVISEDDIKASGATTIPELLRSVPGVDVMEPNQSQLNVSIRGFNSLFSNTVLIMIDGRRVNEGFNTSMFWITDPILLSRIKRIEIVRGPGSVLYGADAFNGVINVILKTPAEMAAESKPGAFVGSYESHTKSFAEASYTVSKKNDWAMTIGAGNHGITGLYSGHADCVQDSSNVPIFTLDLQKQTPHGSLLFSVDNSDAGADLSSQFVLNNGAFHTTFVSMNYNEDRGANPISARIYENLIRTAAPGFYGQERYGEIDIQQQRQLNECNSLTYGGTYRGDESTSNVDGSTPHKQQINSLFLQEEDQLGSKTTLFAGVRDDDDSAYGTQISSRISLVNHLSPTKSLRVSYGTAFSAPTISDEYEDFSTAIAPGLSTSFVNNTSLQPEKINSTEVGYRVDLPSGYVGLSVFYNNIFDIIVPIVVGFAPPPFPAGIPTEIQYQNQGTAHATGCELEGSHGLSHGWNVLANYSYQNVRDENGQQVAYSPDDKVNLVVQSDQHRRLSSYFAGHYVSNSISNGQTLRAYSTVDARIAYRLGRSQKAWTAALASTNLLDDHHREYLDQAGQSPALAVSERAFRTISVQLSGKF
jgi:outer membrane cobalamin receptor